MRPYLLSAIEILGSVSITEGNALQSIHGFHILNQYADDSAHVTCRHLPEGLPCCVLDLHSTYSAPQS